jgi:hypothetical protein
VKKVEGERKKLTIAMNGLETKLDGLFLKLKGEEPVVDEIVSDEGDAPIVIDAEDAPIVIDAGDAPINKGDAPSAIVADAPISIDVEDVPIVVDAEDAQVENQEVDAPMVIDVEDALEEDALVEIDEEDAPDEIDSRMTDRQANKERRASVNLVMDGVKREISVIQTQLQGLGKEASTLDDEASVLQDDEESSLEENERLSRQTVIQGIPLNSI